MMPFNSPDPGPAYANETAAEHREYHRRDEARDAVECMRGQLAECIERMRRQGRDIKGLGDMWDDLDRALGELETWKP